MPRRASAALVQASKSGFGSWWGKMRVLLKKPERTTSRPVESVVQAASRSGETMPSRERSSKMFQRSLPRMEMEEPSLASG